MFCRWYSAFISLLVWAERWGLGIGQSEPKAGISAGLRLYHCHYDLQPNLPGCLALAAGCCQTGHRFLAGQPVA